MPWKETAYGKICPLEKFKIDIPGGAGGYTKDPVETCLSCNFYDGKTNEKTKELREGCLCPTDMSWNSYDSLREKYSESGGALTKKGFHEFVMKNYPTIEEKVQ